MSSVESSSEGSRRFYFADGKKVYLEPSSRFIAVATDGASGDQHNDLTTMRTALGGPHALGKIVAAIPEYQIALVEAPAGERDATLRALRAMRPMADSESLEEPGVFEPAGVLGSEALVEVGEVIAKFSPSASEAERRAILDRHGLEVKAANYPEPGAYVLQSKSDDSLEASNVLRNEPRIEFAQPNFVRLMPHVVSVEPVPQNGRKDSHARPTRELRKHDVGAEPALLRESPGAIEPALTPTDPSFPSQWGLRTIRAPEAWDISQGNAAITVAVIDEGCNLAHEDLSYRLPGYDAVTRTDNQEPQAGDGHGTACAGIVAARANNGRGGVGVAPNCRILPVRIAKGAGAGWYTTDAMIADGIRTAVARGADVLSNSWGGGAPSTAVTNAFQYAQTDGRGGKGCAIAIATGNRDAAGVMYPAKLSPSIRGLLAVGASNEWDERKSKTSRDGEDWWGSSWGPEVDVVAPGVHIFTTDIMGGGGYGAGNYIPNFNGTSSATPHVAGLMALILSVDPNLRSWEVEDIIKLTARELGAAGRDEHFGFGRIDCRRALEAASRIAVDVRPTPVFLGSGRDCFVRFRVRVTNPGINHLRLDRFTLRSHAPDGTVLDQLDLALNPGGTMAPRTGQDLSLQGALLRGNGNSSSWSYRWSASWGYTFWRPGAPALPLGAEVPAGPGSSEERKMEGSDEGGSAERPAAAAGSLAPQGRLDEQPPQSIAIERRQGAITIIIQ